MPNQAEQLEQVALLIAEDDRGDRTLLEKVFKECGIKNRVYFAEDGQELINYLNDMVMYSDIHKASFLILLDLNMPRLNGKEALKILKGDRRFKQIPVLILSTSSSEEDVEDTYKLGANSYFKKPSDYKEFVELAKLIKGYWLQKAILPA